ncbi:MAG: hypothetical protein PWR01_3713 [Clostridiales bacterium]|nr:hypothetical protein [Clostridiales bacterium]MDN5282640.1 hypothetical protein [Candidatus Ozemobacter sp.]
MIKPYIKLFLLTLAVLLLPVSSAFSQNALDLDLNLQLRNKSEFAPMPKSGEFNISLDSQLFDQNLPARQIADVKLEEPASESLIEEPFSLSTVDSMSFIDNNQRFKPGVDEDLKLVSSSLSKDAQDERRFSSTLTLTTGYNDLDLLNAERNELRLEKRMGKFKILGEFEKRDITRIPVPVNNRNGNFSTNANTPLIRGSVINNPINENDQQNKNTALASRYYLEAVYNFQPKVQGKVSYKRSMIDTIESEEELQVEGIVEANRNILIKAGYNNETRPEINEPKATKDSKVWTEFILKF